MIVKIPMKGNALECGNWKGIYVIGDVMKM